LTWQPPPVALPPCRPTLPLLHFAKVLAPFQLLLTTIQIKCQQPLYHFTNLPKTITKPSLCLYTVSHPVPPPPLLTMAATCNSSSPSSSVHELPSPSPHRQYPSSPSLPKAAATHAHASTPRGPCSQFAASNPTRSTSRRRFTMAVPP
jgi:hypothetical protein